MIFEEDVDYFGKHIYVNIGSKQVIAVYLGYYDQEQSWIAVVVKHPYDENDISFKKILIYNSLIESVVPDDVKTNGTDNSDIKEAAGKITDELIDDQDDKDIEAIEGEDIPAEDPNIDYDYDDDELIDAVIGGIDL